MHGVQIISTGKVIGFTVFTMTAAEDLGDREQKSVAVTGSAELSSLESTRVEQIHISITEYDLITNRSQFMWLIFLYI